MPRRTPARFASRTTSSRPSSATSSSASSRRNSSSQISAPTRAPLNHLRNTLEHDVDSSTGYADSISRPSTAITRPPTASGRKSRASSSYLGPNDMQNIICAVSEARGVSPSVGVAFVNTSLGEAILSQICDTQSYVKTVHKMQLIDPSKIIFMPTACPPIASSTLFNTVQQSVLGASLEPFDRSAWLEESGLEYIKKLAFEDDIEPLKVATEGKYYAIASFGAAIKYIENTLNARFAPNSLRIQYRPSADTMMIDISVFKSLEIMQNLQNPKSKDCLFGLLNNTLTPMGARALRSNILQPSTRAEQILTPRYDAVEELASKEDMYLEIRKALKDIRDIEKTLTQIITVSVDKGLSVIENQINQVLLIKSFVQAVPEITQALLPAESGLLVKARTVCDHGATDKILQMIQGVIEPDVRYMTSPLDLRNQRTFAVKSGISSLLDIARQAYKEVTEQVHTHLSEINQMYRIGAALKYDNGRMYWLRIKAANLDDEILPDIFINPVRKSQYFECQTLLLMQLNRRLSEVSDDVVMRSDSVIWDLVKQLQRNASHLFQVAESVALIDMLTSFVHATTTYDYKRPEITGTLALRRAHHPILHKNDSTSVVPNDYYSTDEHGFHIVTGCNMSGKSTYIRSIALLQIMAQVGCFVPAEYASFSVINSMFARVSLDDRIESNLSTFSVEMREMAFIFKNIDHRSMAIIDELGRGTSTRDGLAIAVAMSEALSKSKASVWFATHFIELAKALQDRPGVLNMHLSAENTTTHEGLPHIHMLYKAVKGITDEEEHYGVNLARAIGLPKAFCDKAEAVADDIRTKREEKCNKSESRISMGRRALILTLHGKLKLVYQSGSKEALPEFLQQEQKKFILEMSKLQSD